MRLSQTPLLVLLAAGLGIPFRAAAASEKDAPLRIGAAIRAMPVGWFELADPWNRSFRAYPAFGGSLFLDYTVHPFVRVGVSPSLTLNVIPNRSDYAVGTLFSGKARAVVQIPISRFVVPYVLLEAGYSAIFREEVETAHGLLASGSLGLRVPIRSHAVLLELGYEHGFQELGGRAYAPSFCVVSLGWEMGLLGQ